MIRKNIISQESIKENLETWCYEVGSRFEEIGVDAANEFSKFWDSNYLQHRWDIKRELGFKESNDLFNVVDLGSGDGASSEQLLKAGLFPIAVDINKEKLDKISNLVIKENKSMIDYLNSVESVDNIFAHHSLEHTIDAEEVINLCGKKLKKFGIYYAVVPADDYLHSVHHVVFEDPLELFPEGLELIDAYKRERFGEQEFVCIATRL